MPRQRVNIYIDVAIDSDKWLTNQVKNEIALTTYLSKIAQKRINKLQDKNTNYKSNAEIDYSEPI